MNLPDASVLRKDVTHTTLYEERAGSEGRLEELLREGDTTAITTLVAEALTPSRIALALEKTQRTDLLPLFLPLLILSEEESLPLCKQILLANDKALFEYFYYHHHSQMRLAAYKLGEEGVDLTHLPKEKHILQSYQRGLVNGDHCDLFARVVTFPLKETLAQVCVNVAPPKIIQYLCENVNVTLTLLKSATRFGKREAILLLRDYIDDSHKTELIGLIGYQHFHIETLAWMIRSGILVLNEQDHTVIRERSRELHAALSEDV